MSNPKVKSQNQIVVGPDADAFHFVDTKGNIIGWIDGIGELHGNLTTNAGSTTTSLQGNPVAPIPPAINQALVWNGAAYAPTTISTASPSGNSINFADAEIPMGNIDGVNATFSLLNAPTPSSSLQIVYNSGIQSPDMYMLNGRTFILTFVPQVGDSLVTYYRF